MGWLQTRPTTTIAGVPHTWIGVTWRASALSDTYAQRAGRTGSFLEEAVMAIPPPPAGWTRFLVKSKFGAGRDFAVLDPETDEKRYFVDGKIGTRPKADIKDAGDTTVYTVRGKLLGIPKRITIADGSGAEVASLRAKAFSVVKDKMTLEMASGEMWALEGSLIEKNYSVSSDGRPIIQITQKWVTIRDAYVLDVADGVDPGLALAMLWAVDRWVERD